MYLRALGFTVTLLLPLFFRRFKCGRLIEALATLCCQCRLRSVGGSVVSGDFTRVKTHVPIPNTTVKSPGPMIVPTSAKVGYCRVFLAARCTPLGEQRAAFFVPSLGADESLRIAQLWRLEGCVSHLGSW